MNDELLTTKEVCAILRVKRDWVSRMVRARVLPCVRLNARTCRFRRSDIEAYCQKHYRRAA